MFSEIDTLQTNIMRFIKEQADINPHTSVPRRFIITSMVAKGNNEYTVIHALSALVLKGFIRRAYTEKQNQTSYVMIRNI